MVRGSCHGEKQYSLVALTIGAACRDYYLVSRGRTGGGRVNGGDSIKRTMEEETFK